MVYLLMPVKKKKRRCCFVESVFGLSLNMGVILVGIATIVISAIVFIACVVNLHVISSKESSQVAQQVVPAADMLIAMVATSVSCYQIVVSFLLLWQSLKMGGNVFLTSVWLTSHFSVLTLYFVLALMKTVVSFFNREYVHGFLAIIIGIVYESLFIYFTIIVNSYLANLDRARYY